MIRRFIFSHLGTVEIFFVEDFSAKRKASTAESDKNKIVDKKKSC